MGIQVNTIAKLTSASEAAFGAGTEGQLQSAIAWYVRSRSSGRIG